MKRFDIILLCAALALSTAIFAVSYLLLADSGNVAVVSVDGEEYARLPLDKDTELTVNTDRGYNTVTVKDGKVFVSEASCPDKVCVKTGHADELRSIVCLPNRLTVTVEKGD